ncbi:uncharacterized protein LOC110025771 [Phalaenopsis equestris]|uniref:uncharacterized protein LOC110025771 n=1 Tax=Phalaenopsis equestris TaxID=78828 RepID=UPI0009E50AE0|nr:uncharacterized protein LOC110025771 [Phalaenopsis equestris]
MGMNIKQWDFILAQVELACNKSTSQKTGYSPLEIVCCSNPLTPLDLVPHLQTSELSQDATERVHEIQQIHEEDVDAVDMCLRAINALASYIYREKAAGREGLAERIVDLNDRLQENISSHFLRSLLQLILYEDFRVDLTGSAADALLPLILCEQDLYQRLVQEFLEKQPIHSLRTRLANAFHSLTSSNKLSSSLDRPNRHRFRKNFHEFFREISGLRIK